mgnify:CR=1 FL=1
MPRWGRCPVASADGWNLGRRQVEHPLVGGLAGGEVVFVVGILGGEGGQELQADLHDEKTNKKLLPKGTMITRDLVEKLTAQWLRQRIEELKTERPFA